MVERFTAAPWRIADDTYAEETISFPFARSAQISDAKLERRGKKYWLAYRTQTGEDAQAEVGSADLLFDWYFLRQRSAERREAGDIGTVFFKLALDVQPIDPVGDPEKPHPAIYHFRTASGSNTRHAESVRQGFRVLAVDLGVRSFAACSVFELQPGTPADGLSFPVAPLDLSAVHERSFTLQLDRKVADTEAKIWPREKDQELRRLRGALGLYRNIRGLVDGDAELRRDVLDYVREGAEEYGWPFETTVLPV